MSGEIVEFSMDSHDVAELDRLAAIYADGDRDAFLRDAIRFMASRERAERLQRKGYEVRLEAAIEACQ